LGTALHGPPWLDQHEIFVEIQQGHLGRSADDPYFSWNRYPDNRGDRIQLANGNTELPYFWWTGGRERKCVVYFEADARSNRIIGVRFEGTKETCYHVL